MINAIDPNKIVINNCDILPIKVIRTPFKRSAFSK